MGRQTQLEKAIAGIEADIAVLQATKARLVKQQDEEREKKQRKAEAAALIASAADLALVAEVHGLVPR